MSVQNGTVDVEFLSTLSRHSRTVNVVRFSPDGTILASGADDSAVILWKLSDLAPATCYIQDCDEENRESWIAFKVLRNHLEDVYDISWSSDSKMLLSGSVDNTAILWDVDKGQKLWMFADHKSFVQGVALDPLNQFITTISDDRSLRIFAFGTRQLLHDVRKLPIATGKSRMFHSADTMKSFFRRLAFSPDGHLLVVPAGCWENPQSVETGSFNATYVFCRSNLARPVLSLIGCAKPTLAVRFCPLLFKLRNNSCTQSIDGDFKKNEQAEWLDCETLFRLPYRMIFAVASENEVLLYDTQQRQPLAYFANLHYHTLSDLTWSHDGRLLVISSTDGYCTLITFDAEELGLIYETNPNASALDMSAVRNDDLNLVLDVSDEVSQTDPGVPPGLAVTVPSSSGSFASMSCASTTSSKLTENSLSSAETVAFQPSKICDAGNLSKAHNTPSDKHPRRIQLMTLATDFI
jgi:chromatin assembly factor 1 subunit B